MGLAPPWADAQNRLSSSAEIDAYLTSVVRDTRIPGIVALVADADRVVYTGAFGRQDVAGGVPMANDSIFRIASMTKPVTSVAIMMLVQEGDIGLDDPVSDYLPAFEDQRVIENFNRGGQELHDAAGRHADDGSAPADAHVRTWAIRSRTILSRRSSAPTPGASATRLPLLHDPGTRWTYGESTRVLGTLVEEVSGQPLDEFLSERIFVPLGMSDTFYTVPAQKVSRVVTVHRTTADGLVETPNPRRDHGARLRRWRPALDGRRLREIHPAVPERRARAERHAALERSDGRTDGREPHRRRVRRAAACRVARARASRSRSAPDATSSAWASRSRPRTTSRSRVPRAA